LADDDRSGLGMFKRVANGLVRQRGRHGHRDVASHPDRQVRNDPVGAVLRENSDMAAFRQVQLLQPAGQAAGLVTSLPPTDLMHLAIRHRLDQPYPVWMLLLPTEKCIQYRDAARPCLINHSYSAVPMML